MYVTHYHHLTSKMVGLSMIIEQCSRTCACEVLGRHLDIARPAKKEKKVAT